MRSVFWSSGPGALCQTTLKRIRPAIAGKIGITLTFLALIAVILAQAQVSVTLFIVSAVMMGFGQSLSQYAGLVLLNGTAPNDKRAEVNAAFFLGGYVAGGSLVLLLGFASGPLGLLGGSMVFTAGRTVILLAGLIGLMTSTGKRSRI
ncbi:hypothetical protein [Breoghania sp.]|uniref:hypothetical protein n=1 Tax=Breoghania sp. TaxID=2065378 RepID=UPI00260BC439|nr:hypothetical protein [Breoghania sp.]MDJ0930880.1 hypothetical protein [Breoghania sp.]